MHAYLTGQDRQLFVIEEHDERIDGKTNGHEELDFVVAGHARFVVEGELLDAPAGTFFAVRDPNAVRSARAVEKDTLVLAMGARAGHPFEVPLGSEIGLASQRLTSHVASNFKARLSSNSLPDSSV